MNSQYNLNLFFIFAVTLKFWESFDTSLLWLFWIIQAPEVRVYPETQEVQVSTLEVEHSCQFCTWQLATVSLTSFCAALENPETNEVI